MRAYIWAVLPALVLAGCQQDSERAGTSNTAPEVSINAKDEDGGAVKISANGSASAISINGDGVSINARLPGMGAVDMGGDFDIDGVKLYPGAKIISVNIDADSGRPEGSQGQVRFGLTAPDTPGKVADWYAKAFAAKGVVTTISGTTLDGKTSDGDAFSIRLTPDGAGTKGEILLTG